MKSGWEEGPQLMPPCSVTTWKQEMLAHLKRKEFTAICYYQEICAIVQYLQKSNSIQVEGTLATFANAAGNKEISAWLTPIGRGTCWEYLKTTENIFQRQFWFEKRKNPSRNNSKETLSPITERGMHKVLLCSCFVQNHFFFSNGDSFPVNNCV